MFFNGNLVSFSVFFGFSVYDVLMFDINYWVFFEILCVIFGIFGFFIIFFIDMIYIQELRIIGCNLDSGILVNVFFGM